MFHSSVSPFALDQLKCLLANGNLVLKVFFFCLSKRTLLAIRTGKRASCSLRRTVRSEITFPYISAEIPIADTNGSRYLLILKFFFLFFFCFFFLDLTQVSMTFLDFKAILYK